MTAGYKADKNYTKKKTNHIYDIAFGDCANVILCTYNIKFTQITHK